MSHISFKRSVVIDKVTKKIVGSLDWRPEKQPYMMIATPEVPGYITSHGPGETPDSVLDLHKEMQKLSGI
ncbi:mucin-binding protein [Lactobacillus amylovorus]|uniref:mucin-binding protein n=1 Tax=Lactobacillus amylovorus TaxID=1604 RepID=UPI002FF48F32